MGHSYPKKPSTTSRTPPQWQDEIRHKYCNAVDVGRTGKPNKVHRCSACLAIKARMSRYRDGERDHKASRREKMSWHMGPGGDESY
ncbi:hypothetical protein VTH82DRAFT_7842 [Thermothelomyces myriococcoides]